MREPRGERATPQRALEVRAPAPRKAASAGRGAKKAASRQRILSASARLFREQGIAGASVNDVMAGASLTRGGFYAHFRDKNDLVEQAIHEMFDQAERQWLVHEPLTRKEWLRRAMRRYLANAHVDAPGEGCALPALTGEIGRTRAGAGTLTRRTARMIDLLATRLATNGDPVAARAEAMVLLATCVGAIASARAMTDRALARELLDTVERTLVAS